VKVYSVGCFELAVFRYLLNAKTESKIIAGKTNVTTMKVVKGKVIESVKPEFVSDTNGVILGVEVVGVDFGTDAGVGVGNGEPELAGRVIV